MYQSTHTNSFHANDSFTLEAMTNLGDLLSASAARNPQKAAIAFEDRSISYDSMWFGVIRMDIYGLRAHETNHRSRWFQHISSGKRVGNLHSSVGTRGRSDRDAGFG
ncbi:MAG TPA: hypothetical protein VH139_04910 [Acidobacteriaceae bacterium]|nr:hypothetical protein [Acidobacteriaceae bacterium]